MDPNILLNKTLTLIVYPPFKTFLFWGRVIFLSISFLMLALIFWFIFHTIWLKARFLFDFVEFATYHPYGVKRLFKQWAKVKGKLETGIEAEYKMAVIEADSILEDVLNRMGFAGETLGERLKQLNEDVIPNAREIKEAHQIRNNIIHDPDYKLRLEDAQKTILTYEKAFTEFGFL